MGMVEGEKEVFTREFGSPFETLGRDNLDLFSRQDLPDDGQDSEDISDD